MCVEKHSVTKLVNISRNQIWSRCDDGKSVLERDNSKIINATKYEK